MTYEAQLKAAKTNKEVKEITVTFVPFKEKGSKILGKLLHVSQIEGRRTDSFYNQYLFDTDGGKVKFQCGGVFDAEIGPQMKVGGIYLITFQGKEEIDSGRTVNTWKVDCIYEPKDKAIGGDDDVPF